MNYGGSRVLVLGLGDTGLSMTRWLAARGAAVRVADTRSRPPHASIVEREFPGVTLTCGAFPEAADGMDMIAISPGIDPRMPLIHDARRRGVPVVGDVELFARTLATGGSGAGPAVVAVTGTNGKSTVTAMTDAILRAGGKKPVMAGNIGLPVLDALNAIERGELVADAFVLELSSFQLETTASLTSAAATILNVTEDHMDRYDGLSDYAAAKARIFDGTQLQVVNREDGWSTRAARKDQAVHSFGLDAPSADDDWGVAIAAGASALMRGTQAIMPIADLPTGGMHNAANALAAMALASAVGVSSGDAAAGLRGYRGLPHRVEPVGEAQGIVFIDDSKGTNVGATVAALSGSARPVVLIAGGDGKGQDFTPLAPAVATRARAIVLIGRDARQIEAALAGTGVPVTHAATLPEAVAQAHALAKSGDAVMLSPACASLDMFRNYLHRAEVFVESVREIERREARC